VSDTPDRRSSAPSRRQLEQAAASDASITSVHVQLLREKPEPTEGFSPIPIFILFVFSALIFAGGIYIGTKSGGFSALSFDVTNQQVSAQVAPPPVDMGQVGQRLYSQTCVTCHQQTGEGAPGAYPPLKGSPYVLEDEERLIKIVAHGLQGPIEVLGNSYNSVMPAFHGPTSAYRYNEQKIAAVLTYVRSAWGNNAPPVTEEKVREVLGAVGTRSTPWTVGELGGN
jgi:mono/diheme cytochrome c family protein